MITVFFATKEPLSLGGLHKCGNSKNIFLIQKERVLKKDPITKTKIKFLNKRFSGNVTCVYPKSRANKVHRLWISEELTDELKKVFMMSHMRDIESALRGDVGDIEKQIPFGNL